MGNLRNSTVGLIAATLLLAAPALADTATPPTVPATATTAPATDAPLPLAGKTLKVGMRLVPPFVFKKDDALTGFSYELWAELAKATGATTDLQLIDTLPHVLEAVSTQKVDLAIYSISITAKRELDFDFSQPMFDAGLQVAVRSDASGNASAWSAIARMFTSGPILNLFGLLALLILVPAHLVWLFDRFHPQADHVAKPYFPGIFRSIWWATGAAGGQQMDNPRSAFGKFVQALLVFVSVIFIAYFTAAVTSAMTVEQLKGDIAGPEDLPGRKVGVVAGSTSAVVVEAIGAKTIAFPAVTDALEALTASKVDAVVYDAPVLMYFAAHAGKGKVQVMGSLFHRENYGILFPPGSPLRKPINEALLKLRENGIYDAIYKKWFSAEGGG